MPVRALCVVALACLFVAPRALAQAGVQAPAAHRYEGVLHLGQTRGAECPPGERLRAVVLSIVESAGHPRFTGTLAIGEESIKTFAGDALDALALHDPLVDKPAERDNRMALDRWPQPTSMELAFELFRLQCRVIEARAEIRPASHASAETLGRAAAALPDAELLARIYEGGRSGDPRLGKAEGEGAYLRLREQLGPDHAVTIEARYLQMMTAQDTGDLRAAASIGDELGALFARIYGASSGPVARMKAAAAFTKWRAGRSAEAIEDQRAALDAIAASLGTRSRPYLRMLSTQANFLALSGRHDEGLQAARDAERLAIDVHGPESRERIEAAYNLYRVQFVAGRAAEVRSGLAELLPIARQAVGEEDSLYINLIKMAGSAAFSLRLYDEAEAAIGVVLQYWERRAGTDNPETVSALHNLGSVQAQRGQTDEAEKTFLAAYARLPRDGTRQEARPNLENNLGKLYLDRGDLDQAGRWLALAADHMVAYYGEREPRTLTVLTARGHWQWLRGDLDEGIATLERIEQVQQSVGGTAAQDRLHTLSVLAAAHRRRGDRDKETHLLQEIVRQAEAFRTQGRADVGSRSAWLRDRIPDYRRLALLRAEEGRLDEAFALSELAKGRRLLDQLGEQAALSAGVVDPREASKLRVLAAEIASLESRQPSVDDPVERARIAAALLERRHEYQRVRDALRASSQRFAALTDVTPVDLPAAQRLLGTRQLAISYLVDAGRLLVLVLDGRDVRAASVEFTPNLRAAVEALPRLAARLPGEPGERLWQQADGTRTWSLGRPQDAVEVPFAALARELGAALLSPASAQLSSERDILILPDGALAALPFELLHAAGAPLFRRHAVHYAQSMSVYQRVVDASRPRRTSLRQPLLAVGAPTFGKVPDDVPAAAPLRSALYRSEGIAWRPLPGARREIEAVARAVPGARKLVGDDASEERLQAMDSRGELLAFQHLHFATHAFFSSDRPELSAIVLRQPGNERADGFLTAAELARYTLDSELTVLSACETAQGRSVDGEGVMGFAYALLVAGNRSTVAALWKVPDDATSELMVAFFRHLRSGQSQAAALAAAKRQLRRSPRFAAPVHWAGFVLYGRP